MEQTGSGSEKSSATRVKSRTTGWGARDLFSEGGLDMFPRRGGILLRGTFERGVETLEPDPEAKLAPIVQLIGRKIPP